MKRTLTLLLAVIMCFSCTAFAADFKDTANHPNREAIDVINTLNVIEGYPNGDFGPNETLTRAQAATMLVRAVLPNQIINYSGIGFEDVSYVHWAYNYITTAYAYGIVNGYGNGTFGPENQVTYVQFATMILNTLGYKAVDFSWPQGIIEYGMFLHLFDNVQMVSFDAPCTRAGAAQMIYNALSLNMVTRQNNLIYTNKATLLDALGFTKVRPTLVTKGDHCGEFLMTFQKNNKDYITATFVSKTLNGVITSKNQVKVNNSIYNVEWDKVALFKNGERVKSISLNAGDEVTIVTLYDTNTKSDVVCSVIYTEATIYLPGDPMPADVARVLRKDKNYNSSTSTVTYINEDEYYISNEYIFNRVIESYTARGIHNVILADDTMYNYEGFDTVNAGDWIMIYFDYQHNIVGFQTFTQYQDAVAE